MSGAFQRQYDEYIAAFCQQGSIANPGGLAHIFNKMRDHEKFITEWERSDLDRFIQELHTISVNSINKYLQFIRKFHRFVCQKEGVRPKKLYLTFDLKQYIDYNKLLSVTLDENRFNMLRGMLTVTADEGEFNYRDKVMVELAWEGLTVNEIKNIRVDNIEFVEEEGAVIHLNDRNVYINDKEIVMDLKMCQMQEKYVIVKGGKIQFRNLRSTPYLIKNIETRASKSQTVSNLGQLFRRAVEREEITIPDIDMFSLSLEDIRRSKILHLFKERGYTLADVKQVIGKKTESDLYWLEELAHKLKNAERDKGLGERSLNRLRNH